jgi:hypothetical protein
MKSVYIGLMIALSGITVMAFGMNLWKVSATLEAHLPWYRRPRFLTGLFGATILNTVLDGIAFSLTPLSLIAPMQGLSIAMTVSIAALGIVGPKESVSPVQWRGMFYTIVGFIICAWYGPTSDAENAFWPLIRHYYNPAWQVFAGVTYASSIFYLLAQHDRSPLRFLLPAKGTLALTAVACAVSGLLAGLLQVQLKILAQMVAIVVEGKPKIACAEAYEGLCRLHVKASGHSTCPTMSEIWSWDVLCLVQTHLLHRTIPAWPVHWLYHWQGWFMVPSALMQLNLLNCALASNDMAVTVPLWSSCVMVFTILAGLLYFEEAKSMGSPALFLVGGLISISGLVVVAQEKGRREQLEKENKSLLQEEDPEQDREMAAIDGTAPTTLSSA